MYFILMHKMWSCYGKAFQDIVIDNANIAIQWPQIIEAWLWNDLGKHFNFEYFLPEYLICDSSDPTSAPVSQTLILL